MAINSNCKNGQKMAKKKPKMVKKSNYKKEQKCQKRPKRGITKMDRNVKKEVL